MLMYGQKGPQKYYYKFKSKFNTELMLVYGQKGQQKYYYKFKSKFNTELMLIYGQKNHRNITISLSQHLTLN